MKALLIRPSDLPREELFKRDVAGLYPPLGLLYLAAALEREGVEVRLCDELVGHDHRARIDALEPGDLVGVTVTSPMVARTAAILEHARRRGCRTAIGGPHPSALPAESLADTGADAAVVGEGELALAEFCRAGSWDGVAGAVVAGAGSEPRFNVPRPPLADLDSLPFPARHLLDWEHYRGTGEFGFVVPPDRTWTTIMGSRGCSYRCTFCGASAVFGRRVRPRSVESVVAEMEDARARWGVESFTFSDDNFVFSEERTRTFCHALLDRGLDVRWSCLTRVDLSPDTLALMKRAGCVLIGFGVESGSEEVLRRVKKRIKLRDVERVFASARRAKIKTKAFFMIGLPGEGPAELDRSVELAIRIRPSYLWLSILVPLPGTRLYIEAPPPGSAAAGSTGAGSYLHSEDPELTRRYRAFLRRFYLRPGYLLELCRNPGELGYYLSMLHTYLRFRLFSGGGS